MQGSKFQDICDAIEKDKNFQPGCGDSELLRLSSIHSKWGVSISRVSDFDEELGKLYHVRMSMYEVPTSGATTLGTANSRGQIWHINNFFISVGLDGTTHTYESYNNGVFGGIAYGYGYRDFLKKICLHDKQTIPFLHDFRAICEQIEGDKNFCPEEHPVQELEELSRSVKKEVTAISEVKDFKDDFCKLARLFQVMSTCYGHGSDTEGMPLHWYSSIAYILVKPSGKTEVYMSYQDGVLDSCILDKNYCEFLGQNCVRDASLGK